MPSYSQMVTAAGDGRTKYLVYDVAARGVARLVAVADAPPPAASPLPPFELAAPHVEVLSELNDVLHQIGGEEPATHAQVVYGTSRTNGDQRALTLYWVLPEESTWRPEDTGRFVSLRELFSHGGRLVGVDTHKPVGLPLLLGRKIHAGTYNALLVVANQLGSRPECSHVEPVAA